MAVAPLVDFLASAGEEKRALYGRLGIAGDQALFAAFALLAVRATFESATPAIMVSIRAAIAELVREGSARGRDTRRTTLAGALRARRAVQHQRAAQAVV